MKKRFTDEKLILPAFPRTLHLPYQPNAENDDWVASEKEAGVIFTSLINVEEKIDGASVGMTLYNGHPLLRNRDHILQKGYYKDTPAKEQFRPMWNWFYDNFFKFDRLIEELGHVSVYGEWCVAQHGLEYDKLPDWFVAYDIYDYEAGRFLAPTIARHWLIECGFTTPRLFHQGQAPNSLTYETLAGWANEPGEWTRDCASSEGVYVKVYDEEFVLKRFKMVRPTFERGALWSPEKLSRNSLCLL